ncbi:MAG: hypothetical protein QGG54_04450 [Gammaproteobacteria bacterium]|jgi:hypothetical protein|nr:hypothetical protein [Gammaproteobacteria bacterium]MDP6537893.1 hypothetical protein [Gammaproteobacteria bacterium]MDP6731906.1 hypothetical protein [Gammaproteobacteria bacterium]|tara:strand:+ start:2635 stop:2886 length:252 start_codon:yes stop_codon:yes gene_type:complete
MIEKRAGFAQYSKILCWVVSFIALLLAILSFTGEGENPMLSGFLWLALAFAFALSAMFLSRGSQAEPVSEAADNSESGKQVGE